MEENENKEAVVNKDEIKEETVKTAQEVKEAIKNADLKNDAKATKGFVTEMFKNPLGRLKEIAEGKDNKDFKFAIILAVIWMIAVCIRYFAGIYSLDAFFKYNFGNNILTLLKTIIAPVIGIIVLSLVVFVFNKNNKKSFVTILTAVTAAKLPTIIAAVLGLLRLFSKDVTRLLTPVSSLCSVVTIVLTFFAVKALYGEEDNGKFLKTFVIIEAIYYVAYLLISYLEIYI